jgi:hypothetical protein
MSNLFLQKDEFERIFTSHLKIETYSKSIDSLFSLRLLNKIDYAPYYQRNYVWDKTKATYFIESILLGTEIPPIIFFNNGTNIEIIDGRQRFETIKKFKDNDFKLTPKGLFSLKQFAKQSYDSLRKESIEIIEIFLDAKIRIIEFEIVNEPKLDKILEDKIKKEIFARYNTGITPLKKAEIDNALYDKEPISITFKNIFKEKPEVAQKIYQTFFKARENKIDDPPISSILQLIRRFLVQHKMPIKYYARGADRSLLLEKLFDLVSDQTEDESVLCNSFIDKANIVSEIKDNLIVNNISNKRFMCECLIWILFVLEAEEVNINFIHEKEFEDKLIEYFKNNVDDFQSLNPHYYKSIMLRYKSIAHFFEDYLKLKFALYLDGNEQSKSEVKEIKKYDDASSKLNELETLRVTKPDPSRESIDDIDRKMSRNKFIVRPTYQRSEVINIGKASSIIESILLGIILPPIFIFKRSDGVSEVVDGQQRILTILGFIGKGYTDTEGQTVYTKNHRFPLKNLRILTELNGKRFDDLSTELQDIILDFELFLVDIEQRLNPEFNPIDLFIRLNDKPYPIREHSFEMWNSWVHIDITNLIKDNTKKHLNWFYQKNTINPSVRDRMNNEELYTSLAYLEFKKLTESENSYLDIYQKNDRINVRVKAKNNITSVLVDVSEDERTRKQFTNCIKETEKFIISKLKIILLDRDIENKKELFQYLTDELTKILRAGSEAKYYVRKLQDFYVLWYLLSKINLNMIKYHRLQLKKDITDIFLYMKNIPENDIRDNRGYKHFMSLINDFTDKYTSCERSIKLSAEEKNEMIKQQKNKCSISGAPIFVGDDIEVDHIKPISIGGPDEINNLGIAHKDENRKKGSSFE